MAMFFRKREASSNRRTRASASNIQGFPPTVSIVTVRTVGVGPSVVVSVSSTLHRQPDRTVAVGATDRAMTAVSTLGTVVKDVGEALEGGPIVKAVAGLVLTVVKIADECQVCKDAVKNLANRLEKTTADIVRLVAEMAPHSERMDPARRNRILQALAEYFGLVQEIEQKLVVLKRYTKWNRLLLRRTALLRQFGDYERELDRAAQNFQRDLLCGIATDVAILNDSSKQQGLRSTEISAFFFLILPHEPRGQRVYFNLYIEQGQGSDRNLRDRSTRR
ncbi:hypothetical protein BDZ89DRAFT_684628 [Hymenopellis radicata]|nr:hypothetical protein BDZ89DRAFT_684628 [Hymenopellis radicata]